jgi:hypothetical protein
MSDDQLFFLTFIAPWLTPLVLGGLVAEFFAIRAAIRALAPIKGDK